MRRTVVVAPAGPVASASLLLGGATWNQRRLVKAEFFEAPLDRRAGERGNKKGPPVAHSLPVYKTAHKLASSARWKHANVVANVAGGKDFRLSETHGEGRVDDTGMYRDWLYGEERRYANYIAGCLTLVVVTLFWYTVKKMGSESWDIPAPAVARPDLVKKGASSQKPNEPSAADRALEEARPRLVRPTVPGGVASPI